MKAVMGVLGKGVAAYFLAVLAAVAAIMVVVAVTIASLFRVDDATAITNIGNKYNVEFPEGSAFTKEHISDEYHPWIVRNLDRGIQIPAESREVFFQKLLEDERWDSKDDEEYVTIYIYWDDPPKGSYDIAVYERKTGRFYCGSFMD